LHQNALGLVDQNCHLAHRAGHRRKKPAGSQVQTIRAAQLDIVTGVYNQ
jgi:hypothetical protein